MSNKNYQKVCSKVLEDLPERQREVVLRRFGLQNGEKETLESIGQSFGVTRERIRQIEADAFSKLQIKKEDRELKKMFSEINNYLRAHGGLRKEDILLTEFGDDMENNTNFLLTFGDNFYRFAEGSDYHSFWANEKSLSQKVKKISSELIDKFKKKGVPIPEKEFLTIAESHKEPTERFLSVVETLKRIGKGPLSHIGLIDWPEIKPNGVKDRAYLTLKRVGEPLHFREIAETSNELEGEFCERKTVLPQTVHNELIRDDRFVLVGRGIYALKEWNYDRGTVKEIIAKILKENGPLSREEVLNRTKDQRLVKNSTILLNLNDKKYFSKDENGRYILKKDPQEA